MDLIVKNGTIITAFDSYQADIGILNGKIAYIGKNLSCNAEVIDATGKLVIPGAIDPHVHFNLPILSATTADDFANGTKSAAVGGVTTIIDFAKQAKGESLSRAVEERRKEADGKVCIDYLLHAAITDWKHSGIKKEIKNVFRAGITSFKMFTTYKSQNMMSDDFDLYSALSYIGKLGGTVGLHAENDSIIEGLTEHFIEKGKTDPWYHAQSHPSFTEEEAVRRAITLTKAAHASLYIHHLSTGEALRAIVEGKRQGLKVYAETCPHYLFLSEKAFKKTDGYLYLTSPPLRHESNCQKLWNGLFQGDIDVVATDNCALTKEQKSQGKSFNEIPQGIATIEHMLPLIATRYKQRNRSLNQLVSITSTNAAKIFGLYPRKGTIAIGSDADLALIDLENEKTISSDNFQTNCDWSPFEGFKVVGSPFLVVSRGEVIAKEGKFIGPSGHGRFIKRNVKKEYSD